ncbi:MAG: hypothetical protein US68_C0006G0048 [Candidatus Shapirobacteria bacterium GW2011_GWE1_38_10]|uniref:Uncharacterized protein n=1 Tax=Candidatus Shapirobacteria bacterium GW2011_GWE1_38_10 TaxID=1618488 RepID=A0A0G0I4V9_9BACT|nr:MAG: hypothetical protein US46_C0002G0131 [Candidatus Shapirobacteria bacterium GW2011_GWF2_37_20]KKQ50368.1 MAG: hypothetical protein US68_C0006G0048 [Candidatus Shapirobacteria bacterium GW2011_GWE1_38_10]KKQ65192.1 MAG: hypothetical protein US85_C0001G0119 [Candidatus Shapirobacteria bacterium GW2011_GWF1_38_23]HBP51315.1 hypothetical protein [Candidatus Shapirobacteria bacterium]
MNEKKSGIFNFLKIESPFDKRVESVKKSLKQLQELAIDNKNTFLWAKAGDNWVATYPYQEERGSYPGHLTCQLLRTKEVAGTSKKYPLGGYYHPNMIYKMGISFHGNEPIEIECVPEMTQGRIVKVSGDKEISDVLDVAFNSTRVVRKVFEFPINRKQQKEFETQLPLIELITRALIENVEI